MALSQLQCLDDNHVNLRTNESKPEFLYCEDQRLALEALLRDGREAFVKYLGARGMRGFLSDPELEALSESIEPYDPGSEIFPENAEDDEPQTPLSLHYWPERSDTSVPQMDLGWPDCAAYRGVTRTTVYTQPPLEGETHIKEVVRKMIAQAQKVIAVVMDVFTDVDIFRDLLDAGFKRKVSVYILLERTTLPHFQSMCQRANMHAGHLKHLRVRCTDGAEFYTRSCTKVTGRMGHRFMFVDGDKAVSGSYSFTWMSSRLDKNLITVVTGQAVEAFDRLFRILYTTSSSVDLRQVATEPEPELEPPPQLTTVLPSAAIARKLYSPKYALVTLGNPSPALSADRKDTQSPEVSKDSETKKQRRGRMSKEQEAPPIHPGLSNLEKACLILYLPTWPEPDPPSDVIGFINIRDAKKPTQVHLQRSEMFETSQAIRFSSPITMPKETLPEVAKPRQLTAKHEGMNKRQPAQDKTTNAKELLAGRARATELSTGPGDIKSKAEAPAQKSPASRPKCESDTIKILNAENKLHSNTHQHAPPQSSSKASTPHTATTFPGSHSKKDAETEHRMSVLESSSTQTPHLRPPTDWNSNTEPHTQTKTPVPRTDSHTQAVHTQPRHSSEIIPICQTPSINSHTSSSLTSATCSQSASHTALSENSHVSITTGTTTSACSPLSSISSSSSSIPPLTSSSTTPKPPLLSLTSTPPIPKPRTVQLVIKGSVTGDSQKLPEFSVVRKCETAKQTSQENVPQTAPEQQNSRSKTKTQKDAKNTSNFGEAARQKQSGTSQERKNEEADERYERAGMQSAAGNKAKSDVLITEEPKADNGNIQETIPKDMEPKTLTSTECKLTPQIDAVATVQSEIKSQTGRESSEVPNEKSENETERKTYLARARTPQRISYNESQDIDALETLDSPTHAPISATHTSKDTQGQHGNTSNLTPAHHSDSIPNAPKHNTHQELTPKAPRSKPERSLRLHLPDKHVPELRSPTPEKESRLLAALTRTPTPDGFPPHTPDSQTHTPELRSHTPDFRTPTSDGYVSPRTDSALSTTSEEYYECSDSPFHDPVFDQATLRNHGTKDDNVSVTHINTPNNGAANTASPICKNSSSCVATSGTKDRNTSSSDAQSLSGSDGVSSSSSLLKDEKGRKLSVAERKTVGQYQGTERRGSEDAKRSAGHVKQQRVSTETEHKDKEAQTQAPKRKKVLNHTAAERPASGGELTNERAEPKRLSRGDLQSQMASFERKKPEKEKAADMTALGPSSVEKRGRPPSPRETDIQRLLHTSPKSQRGQQQDSPSRPPRPLPASQALGSRPCGSRQLTQAERKVLHGSLLSLDNTSSPRQPPSRPPPPVTAGAARLAADRKQTDVSHSQQSLLSRQPLAAQGRIRPGLSQNQHRYTKPNSSFLHTHSNKEAQLQPHSQTQKASPQEEHWPEEGRTPFSFTFSKLYSLKGLKDKMSRLPASTKRGSASSPGPVRKSTS